MSDVTLNLTNATPVALEIGSGDVELNIAEPTPVSVNIQSTSVDLDITNATPVNIFLNCYPDFATALQGAIDSLTNAGHVYESDEAAGVSGIAIGDIYITAFNHLQAPGGLIKIRLT